MVTTSPVLIACSSLNPNSTFDKNKDMIQDDIEKYIYSPKYTFVTNTYEPFVTPEDHYDDSLVHYLDSSKSKFKMIVLAQCNNLVQLLSNINSLQDIYLEMKVIYDALITNGYLIHYYYPVNQVNNKATRIDLDYAHAPFTVNQFPEFLLILYIFNAWFKKVNTGVYQKKSVDTYQTFLDAYSQTIQELFLLYKNSFNEKGEFDIHLYSNIINQYYFHNQSNEIVFNTTSLFRFLENRF
jgi:hypothetical protein